MKRLLLAAATISLSIIACSNKVSNKDFSINSQTDYFANLTKLCGKTFVGESDYPKDPNHDFAGKKLVAHFKSCNGQEIRIPFTVGEDKSRTWIITKTDKGLLLKHDHRHKDGTPDEITMYGGYAGNYKNSEGTGLKQHFLADEHTAKLIPDAKSNAWTISYDPAKQELTYYLERHKKPRYKAILQMTASK